MKIPNEFYLRACLWDVAHDVYAEVVYPPTQPWLSVWTHADEAVHAEFIAYFTELINRESPILAHRV